MGMHIVILIVMEVAYSYDLTVVYPRVIVILVIMETTYNSIKKDFVHLHVVILVIMETTYNYANYFKINLML